MILKLPLRFPQNDHFAPSEGNRSRVDNFTMLGKKGESSGSAPQQAKSDSDAPTDDDLPF